MDRQDLARITLEVDKENSLFADKSYLDSSQLPSRIIGRQDKAKELARFILAYKKGHVVPFISVYGRSGSGKSTVVKYVLENLDPENVLHRFVNLRNAKTVFGCANLILGELGQPVLTSAQGINTAIVQIGKAIESIVDQQDQKARDAASGKVQKKLFVLALDEFDVIFYDKRTSPSDFIYKLLVMQERLRSQSGRMVSIIAVSNNVMSDYDVDDRVRSRIGSSSEIFFGPYRKSETLEILNDRVAGALKIKVDPAILEYCAAQSSEEHGDARRAIDLLRVAAEIAGGTTGGHEAKEQTKLTKEHVDIASGQLQKDRIATVIKGASYHFKLVCGALAKNLYVTGNSSSSTSEIYDEYCGKIQKGIKPLSYRRVSELLTELENTGLAVSQTRSMGRHGYGSQYQLTVSPEMIGRTCFPDFWDSVVNNKQYHDSMEKLRKLSFGHGIKTMKKFNLSDYGISRRGGSRGSRPVIG